MELICCISLNKQAHFNKPTPLNSAHPLSHNFIQTPPSNKPPPQSFLPFLNSMVTRKTCFYCHPI